MTYINNNYNNPIQIQRVCSIRAVESLPGELIFSLEDRPVSSTIIAPVIPTTIWGDSFRIYTTAGRSGYAIRIYEKRRMIAIILFDLLDDARSNKTLGGSTDVYSEDSFYGDIKFDENGNETEPAPLHPFPKGDLISR